MKEVTFCTALMVLQYKYYIEKMFYYIDQHRTPYIPIGFVKLNLIFIIRSVKTDLVRSTLVVPMISVDAYPFLAFSDLICYLEDTGIGAFWLRCAI